MNFNNLLQWNYYTEINPQGDFLWGYLFLIFFVLTFMSKGFAENLQEIINMPKNLSKKYLLNLNS
jgi:hypothetical protein